MLYFADQTSPVLLNSLSADSATASHNIQPYLCASQNLSTDTGANCSLPIVQGKAAPPKAATIALWDIGPVLIVIYIIAAGIMFRRRTKSADKRAKIRLFLKLALPLGVYIALAVALGSYWYSHYPSQGY